MRIVSRWRFRLVLLLFVLIPALPLYATGKRLAPGHVPAVVARGNIASLGALPGTNQLKLALCLPLRNAPALTNLLKALYTPGSPEYHHFLTPKEFTARFGPTPEDYAAVIQFAKTNHLTITATNSGRLLVNVSGRVTDVERALHVTLHSYRHPSEQRNFFAPTTEPTVDARVPLLHVSGLDNYSRPHPNVISQPASSSVFQFTPNGGSSPYGTYMGNDFRQAYLPGTTLTGAGQSVALVQFDGFNPQDITNYANIIGLTNSMPQVIVENVDGGVPYPGGGSVEVTLDIEMVMAMAPGVSNIFVYESPGGSWADMLSQIANDNFAAQVSCSWSAGPEDPAGDQYLLKMAVQGQSFFCASGDLTAYTNLVPFPCGSPYVTSVGGTYLDTDTNGDYSAEAVWNWANGQGSGGGISPLVWMPDWQQGVISSTTGGSMMFRNIPDVSLTADQVYLIYNNQEWTEAGTSCAAPLWAGIAALINQQAASQSLPQVGFLNPALYTFCQGSNYPAMFHDIVIGNNTNAASPTEFNAVPGYDLATGWGTPAGTNLINVLLTQTQDTFAVLSPVAFSTSGLNGYVCPQTNWTFTLTNTGPIAVDWALGSLPAWLQVSVTNGTLAPSNSTSVTVQLLGSDTLSPGLYPSTLSFTNTDLSTVHNAVIQVEVRQNLVDNGGFETGDFTGWTLAGDTIIGNTICNVVATDWNFPGLSHSGYFGAFLGEGGYEATLSQTLMTTPGQQYVVSCWLSNPQSGGTQLFDASWNGTDYMSLTNPPVLAWTNLVFLVTAVSTNDTLTFAAENDYNYFGFDDVSVLPMPPVTLSSCCVSTNGFQMTWPSVGGLNYQVQYSTNLVEGNWQSFDLITATTNVTTFIDTNSPNDVGQCFYRLVFVP